MNTKTCFGCGKFVGLLHIIDAATDACTCGEDAGLCLGTDDIWTCYPEAPCAHCAFWMGLHWTAVPGLLKAARSGDAAKEATA